MHESLLLTCMAALPPKHLFLELLRTIFPSFGSGSLIYLGERLNNIGRRHWENFATQNYFDEHGVFFSALVSGPLLLLLFMLLVRALALDGYIGDSISLLVIGAGSFTCPCTHKLIALQGP